jgi:DNA-binding NtrC family response regulator
MAKQNIVIADLDTLMAQDIASLVGEMGYRVFLAENLRDVIDVFEKWDVGMMILDTSVLTVEGFEMIDIVRQLKKEVPIIITTGTPTEQIERDIRCYGIVYYAPKPVDYYWIKEIVRRSFKQNYLSRSNR